MRSIEQYTEQEIDALEAGPEIRALVARDVMGFEPMALEFCFTHKGDVYVIAENYTPRTPHKRFMPDSDIGAAYPIGERMKELGEARRYGYELSRMVSIGEERRGNFLTAGSERDYILAHASPLQRCKAALKAVRAQRMREVKNG